MSTETKRVRLIPNDQRTLTVLDQETHPQGEMCVGFARLADRTGFDRRVVRLSARRLARKGLAEFHKGLCRDDGDFAGSGYCISQEGRQFVERSWRS